MNSSVAEKASNAWRTLKGCEEDGDTAVFTEMGDRFASYVEYYVNCCPDRDDEPLNIPEPDISSYHTGAISSANNEG
jgi:hypothetical protein